MPTVCVFPGQGSQAKGMGEGLFERFEALTAEADSILGYSLKELCLEDPNEQLNQTQFTQPALYAVSAMAYLARQEDGGEAPAFLAGHSLGEYAALFAAGAFDFATGLRLVAKRGEIMSKAQGGGMAAVLGLDPDGIRTALDANGFDTIDIANYNSPKQTVISGLKDDIVKAESAITEAGAKRYVVLNVSGAFHSRYMSDAADEFSKTLAEATFADLTIPVIANLTGKPYEAGVFTEYLQKQINHSVRWTDTVMYLKEQGEVEFEEVGPGKVLTALIRQIR